MALIQLCSSQGLCALFRIHKFSAIPLNLKMLLEDPEVIKAGVTPCNDAKYLMQDYAISVNSTFDLRFLALVSNHKAEGLGKLSKSILNIELDKNWKVRCSDWEIEKLSAEQVDYAAKDAFVAIEIFRKLYKLIRPGALDPESIRRFCDNYTDITFKNKLAQMNLDPALEATQKFLQAKKAVSKNSTRSYTVRATPLYHNCHLQAPDGELLCTCDRSKAEWYVKKGLGVEIPDQPSYTVRLNFEPAGRCEADYYRSEKENRCVVCGSFEELIRKHVIPFEYRKFFPKIMKEKTSHDVLLMCTTCHRISNISDLKIRQTLQTECEAPLSGLVPKDDVEESKKLHFSQRAARALLNVKHLPEHRKVVLTKQLAQSYPEEEINEEFLKYLVEQEAPLNSNKYPSHGEIVVEKFKANEGIVDLERMWRQHFLKAMEPKFLPPLWDINHNETRLVSRAGEGRVVQEDLEAAGVKAEIVPRTNGHQGKPLLVVTSVTETEPVACKINETAAQSTPIIENGAGKSKVDKEDDTDSIDTSSEWEFRSAAGSRSSKADLDRTLTEDERYFSDVQSFYETIRSDGSTLDDFQSFASSLTDQTLGHDSEGSRRSSLSSQDLSIDSDTEVEDDPMDKMEM